jgi:aspartate aminotransferase-like enzyme
VHKQLKYYLMAPGPTPVLTQALSKMSEPLIHHRTPLFEEVMASVREGLKYLFQTEQEVLILSCSGTGSMEGAVSNFMCRGDKAICVRGGKFGERWSEICTVYGVEPLNIDVQWGEAVDPAIIADMLQKDSSIKGVFIQASETSTAVAHPIKEIAEIVKKYDDTIFVVDGISAVGVFPLPMDEWGIDILLTGSQKSLMLPPGLAFAAVSEKAWKFYEKSDLPKYYFDLGKQLKKQNENQSTFTPAVTLVIGLKEVLDHIRAEGLDNIFERHDRLARATREAVKAMGLELLAKNSPSSAVTAIKSPEGINGGDVVKLLRNKHNITIAGGQAQLKGKIFRIAHLGYVDIYDVIIGISALEMALSELGYKFQLGKGVAAALEIFNNDLKA